MHPDALTYLSYEVKRIAPFTVLEFGSGSSTTWLASIMKKLHGETGEVRVFSIEQDERTATAVRGELERRGLGGIARIHVAPLREIEVWGRRSVTYGISPGDLDGFLGVARPDLVLIDGPAADPGARFGTLPLVVDHLAPGATFYLDDALRHGELLAGAGWAESGRIDVFGVHLVGRGLLSGRIGPVGR